LGLTVTQHRLRRRADSGVINYIRHIGRFNINIRLLLLSSVLSGIAQGMFSVDFNLYVLSLGIEPDGLGRILSAGPFAHALAAIPIGFLGEFFGYRVAFTIIYGLAGISQLVQVATGNAYLMATAAFVGGLALSGNFVVRIPFLAANVSPGERTHVFSINSLLNSITVALGALLAGFLPNLLSRLTVDLTLQYRYTLYIAGLFTVISVIPILFIEPQIRRREHKISLKPYLWGIDAFTIKSATVELFIGLTLGLIIPFMNLYFIFHLGANREFYSSVEALSIIFTTLAAAIGPMLALKWGNGRAIVLGRYLVPVSTLLMAVAAMPAMGTAGYWSYRAIFTMSQSLWFAYAMGTASPKAKVAVSAWLEIMFWLGRGLAAIVTGSLLADANYTLPFYLSTVAALLTAFLTHAFIERRTKSVPTTQASEST
jgi:MFS family permease